MQKINYSQESKKIIQWIQKVFLDSGLQKVVIGLSGGIDSAVACALVTQAIGKENVIPVLLPYGSMSTEGIEDAKKIVDFLRISKEQIKEINIQSGVDGILNPLNPFPCQASELLTSAPYQGEDHSLLDKEGLGRVRRGNIMARVRMIYLFDFAKQYKGLVCGTENKSEHYLGYFTRFGDEASDIEPIRHLYKTHIWEMANYLGLPEKVITKAPTAGLWAGQTDEDELGFSYQQADEVLSYFIDEKLSQEEIIHKGIEENIVENVLKRVKANDFKRHLPFIYS